MPGRFFGATAPLRVRVLPTGWEPIVPKPLIPERYQ